MIIIILHDIHKYIIITEIVTVQKISMVLKVPTVSFLEFLFLNNIIIAFYYLHLESFA